jgi:hypothetical protein
MPNQKLYIVLRFAVARSAVAEGQHVSLFDEVLTFGYSREALCIFYNVAYLGRTRVSRTVEDE